ncbi:exosortase [Chitinolyticbacter meiyuanensis]|uniref:exosortase n=1 Tax=Chitinolyticbacter meiyuanensis TaxID=682798 RepID=UPI0011E5F4F9|nr:exosortase [Chitinolyticbacter meiyuanensis]
MHTETRPVPVAGLAVLVVAALLVLVPTWLRLSDQLWHLEAYSHAPIILAIVAWICWRQRHALAQAWQSHRVQRWESVLAIGILVMATLFYIIGRSQNLPLFESVGHWFFFIGATLWLVGWPGVRALWFAYLLFLFAVPIPGFLIMAATGSLKALISSAVEQGLYAFGYPVARSGVVLTIGQYQLLVADACSGLNSLYSLAALGLVYVYLAAYPQRWRNGWLLAAILPVAVLANFIRVLALVLITYHYGDEAGQGFVHDFAGFFVFGVALVVLFLIDLLLGMIARRRPTQAPLTEVMV